MAYLKPNRLLDLVALVDNVPLGFESDYAPYYRLFLSPDDPRPHGYILPETVAKMPWPPSFAIDHDAQSVTISSPTREGSSNTAPTPAAHINSVLQQAVDAAIKNDVFPILNGMHSEPVRILGARQGLIQVERFAASLFGIATRGAHMTGYTKSPTGDISIWVARRSQSLNTYPGKLDSTVAGGVKATDTPARCILAEAAEEASLPESLIRSACVPTGVITSANRNSRTGLFHSDVVYVYDLLIPEDVVPRPGDDEVEEFVLMPMEEVRRRMEGGEFKPNVCAVMIDFMIRHGFVTPESEGEASYVDISNRLRRRLPVPLASDRSW